MKSKAIKFKQDAQNTLCETLFNEIMEKITKHSGQPDFIYFPKHDKIVYVGRKRKKKK